MVVAQESYNLKNGVATLANLANGLAAGTFLAQTNGVAYYVDPANGSNTNDGKSPATAVADIPTAFALTTANQHDTVYYMAGSSGTNLEEQLVWNKNYTHLIGIAAPSGVATRARIFQTSTSTDLSPLLNITASGCIFENFYIFQGVDDTGSLVNVQVTGGRNFFRGVHFAGGGHATQAIDGGASLLLSGAEENRFVDCTIGVDTIAAATGMAGLVVAATGGAARNRFYDCEFRMFAGDAAAIFVELLGNSGLDRDLRFVRCDFTNLAAQAMTQVFAVDSGFDTANKRVLIPDCWKIGAGKWDDGDTGMIFGNMDAYTSADLGGNLVVMQE